MRTIACSVANYRTARGLDNGAYSKTVHKAEKGRKQYEKDQQVVLVHTDVRYCLNRRTTKTKNWRDLGVDLLFSSTSGYSRSVLVEKSEATRQKNNVIKAYDLLPLTSRRRYESDV